MVRSDPGSPSDDVDPSLFFNRASRNRSRDRKTRMLCAQVADCLQLLFEGGVGDAALQDAWLREVDPFPDAGTLRVAIEVPSSADVAAVAAALERASGFLRSEVAAAICRKRAPQLVFRVVREGS